MSQLRNLLTNKVIAHKLGGETVAGFRRSLRARGRTVRSVRQEIAERQELAAAHQVEQKAQKIGILGRVSRFLRRVAKGG